MTTPSTPNWTFEPGEGVIADPLFNSKYLYEIYTKVESEYTGRVTVPILWDKQTHTIVNNESSEIIRMFNSAFDQIGAKPGDYYPEALRDTINSLNERIYNTVNNGVYKCGFATTQTAYEEALPEFLTKSAIAKHRSLTGSGFEQSDRRFPQPTVCCQILS